MTIGLAVVVLVGSFLVLSDEDVVEYDYTGIIHGIKETTNGFTFYIDVSNGDSIRCFSKEEPADLGYYGVCGSLSDDGTIFFVSHMYCLDET